MLLFIYFKEFAKNSEIKIDLAASLIDKFRIEQFSDNITIHFLDIGKRVNFKTLKCSYLVYELWNQADYLLETGLINYVQN